MTYLNAELENEVLKALDILTRERELSVSAREWKHRLVGYGYRLRETEAGQMITKLPQNQDLCLLPETLN